MNNNLTLLINDEIAFECNRETTHDDQQLAFLDGMDVDMDKGIKIRGELIKQPEVEQRLTFMALNLIKALKLEDQGKTSVSCAYLLSRRPKLIEIRVTDMSEGLIIDFVDAEI